MAKEDKIMGLQGGSPIYGSHRIDIATTADIRFDDAGGERFSSAVKSPAPGHTTHTSKAGYDRKVIVPDAATRDEVTAYLDGEGISYTVESVAPTASEKDAIEQWGAEHGAHAADALDWDAAVEDLDAGLITQADFERGKNPNRGDEFKSPLPDRKG